jgi:hypothetical protein
MEEPFFKKLLCRVFILLKISVHQNTVQLSVSAWDDLLRSGAISPAVLAFVDVINVKLSFLWSFP